VARKEISLMRLVEALSAAPARILGLAEQGSLAPGKLADVTVLDLEQEAVIDAARFRSLSRNTPFDGWTVRGQALLTLVGGRIVHDARLG
jgi:dihydroorotase